MGNRELGPTPQRAQESHWALGSCPPSIRGVGGMALGIEIYYISVITDI